MLSNAILSDGKGIFTGCPSRVSIYAAISAERRTFAAAPFKSLLHKHLTSVFRFAARFPLYFSLTPLLCSRGW